MISNKKIQKNWMMYDWAISVYNLVITSTFFPIYYELITKELPNQEVKFLGIYAKNTVWYDWALAFAFLIVALSIPFMTSVADKLGRKKQFMMYFTILGSMSCSSMYFFNSNTISLGLVLLILATIGYCGAQVFYNSYLPDVAKKEEQDSLSARGFTHGYVGSVILQIIGFGFVLMGEEGIIFPNAQMGILVTFIMVGAWWLIFGIKSINNLPKIPVLPFSLKAVFDDSIQILKVATKGVFASRGSRNLTIAFFLYSTGVQTIMLAAVMFGTKILSLDSTILIAVILAIQLVAIPGALGMSKLSTKIGNIHTIIVVVLLWVVVCIGAYLTTTPFQFYCVAVLVGILMGGIQSMSRSTFSKLLPDTKNTASYFSFFDVTEKLAIVVGMFFIWIGGRNNR